MNQSRIEDNKVVFSECSCSFDVVDGRVKFCADLHRKNHNINFDCPTTYELLGKGLTQGVFQLQSPLGIQWCSKIKPECIDHISALGSVLRPGCLESKSDDGTTITVRYERKKNGKMELTSYHPIVDEILKDTYGENIYQEESIELAKQCAGFSLQEGDALRKAAGKKLPEEMAKMKKLFLEKGKQLGIFTEQQLEEIFSWIESSQRYSFNKSLVGNTYVETYHGYKQINELNPGDMILCPSECFYYDEWHPVIKIHDHGNQDTFRVEFDNSHIICTLEHKFLCEDAEIRQLRDLFGYYKIQTKFGAKEIVNIKYHGNVPTYDIELANTHHLFYANKGIITSNSHALSYGLISYITAYIKCHFPVQFYKCWLANEDKREEYINLVNEAKLFDINVYCPDLRDYKYDFYARKRSIYFGLSNIKGIVKKDIDKLAQIFAENNWAFSSLGAEITWLQFLSVGLEGVGSKTAEGLIHSGSLDFFGIDRARLYYEYERWNRLSPKEKRAYTDQPSLEKLVLDIGNQYKQDYLDRIAVYNTNKARREASGKTYKTILEEPTENQRLAKIREIYQELTKPIYRVADTIDSIIFAEENLLGVALTRHKTDEVINAAETATCLEIAKGKRGYNVLRVRIDECRPYRCKNDTVMGFLKLSDKTGQLSAVIFKEYDEYQHLLTRGNIVFVSGELSKESFCVKRVYGVS